MVILPALTFGAGDYMLMLAYTVIEAKRKELAHSLSLISGVLVFFG